MLIAGTYFGYAGHLWYTFLDRKFPGIKSKAVYKKLLSEMAIGPPFAATIFFIVGKLEGKPLKNSWNDLKSNFVYLCLVSDYFAFYFFIEN